MFKAIFALVLFVACSSSEAPAPPTKAAPMLQGVCVDRVVPNLFGPGVVSYQKCRWRRRVWVCRLEINNWRCVAVTATRTAPAAPAAPSPADPIS